MPARRASGLSAPPRSFTIIKVVSVAVAGVVIVMICNTDRGVLVPIRGVPWVLIIVLGVVTAWSILLGRTTFGRHVYAIGGNAEAARRAGISLTWVRTFCFVLASFTAGTAGIITHPACGRYRRTSTEEASCCTHAVVDGRDDDASQGFSAASKNFVTAIVLVAAVTIDALARRGNVSTRSP